MAKRTQDFTRMYGIIFCNTNHKYIQLYRYYNIIKMLSNKNTMAFCIILHEQLSKSVCNRIPSKWGNLSLKVNAEKGRITNGREMQKFLSENEYLKCNAGHLMDLNSSRNWYNCYKYLGEVGLIDISPGKITPMIPIECRFLPINYACVAFLSRLKRDFALKKSITESLSKLPEKLEDGLKDYSKEDLISEIVYLKTRDLETHSKSHIYNMIYEDVLKKYPHRFGETEEKKKRVNFVDEVLEKAKEMLLQNQYTLEDSVKQESNDIIPEVKATKTAQAITKKTEKKELDLDLKDIPDFEAGRIASSYSSKKKNKNPKSQTFFGSKADEEDHKRKEIAKKEVEKLIRLEKLEKLKEIEDQNDQEFDFIDDIDQEVDLFGIPISEQKAELKLPKDIEKTQDISDFWA